MLGIMPGLHNCATKFYDLYINKHVYWVLMLSLHKCATILYDLYINKHVYLGLSRPQSTSYCCTIIITNVYEDILVPFTHNIF